MFHSKLPLIFNLFLINKNKYKSLFFLSIYIYENGTIRNVLKCHHGNKKSPRFAIIILCPYSEKKKKKHDWLNPEKFAKPCVANAVIDSVSIIDAKDDTTTTGVQYDKRQKRKIGEAFFKTMTRLISGSCRKNRGKGSSTVTKR